MDKNNAYDRAIAAAERITGKKWGAASWLAEQIGVSRQLMGLFNVWGGFPEKHVDDICRVTKLPRSEISSEFSQEVDALARKWRCSVKEARGRVLRAGLAQFSKPSNTEGK